MEVRKICQWCGKPFIAKKTTTCYCSHQCSNLGYKERIRERKRQMRKMQELLQPKQAAEGQDFFSFAQAAKLMGVTRQYVYKLVKESKLRASRISGKKSLIRRADIELMLKTKPYERIIPKDDFDMSEYYTAEEIAEKYKVNAKSIKSMLNGYGLILGSIRFPKSKSANSTITAKSISMRHLPSTRRMTP